MDGKVPTQHVLVRAARGVAGVWTDCPRTPAWWYPACGFWAGVLAAGWLSESSASTAGLPAAFVAAAGVMGWWHHGQWGTWPAVMHKGPPEVVRVIYFSFGGLALLAVLVYGTYRAAGLAPSVVIAAVLAGAGMWLYERRYRDAAAAATARLDTAAADAGTGASGIAGLDPALTVPEGLTAAAILAASTRSNDRFLRAQLQIGADELVEHMAGLEEAGYTKVTARRGRRWYVLTKTGRQAMDLPMAAVFDIIHGEKEVSRL